MTAQFQGVSAATSYFFDVVFQLASSFKINDIGVIACTTYQGVSTASTIKCIGKLLPVMMLLSPLPVPFSRRTCQREVFDVVAQRKVDQMI